MDNILITILTLIVWILLGGVVVWIIFTIKATRALKKANKFLEDAKKEAERNKRDTLIKIKKK